MLKLQRIMEIARMHAHHCCAGGDVGGEKHNIQVLSVAIQEALSENDEKNQPRQNGSKWVRPKVSTNAEPRHTP